MSLGTSFKKILISRTDAIGDVILTLPLVGLIKKHHPQAQICFLGREYTKDIISACQNVDQFINWTELSKKSASEQIQEVKSLGLDTVLHVFPRREIATLFKKAGVRNRIGTSSRLYHWWTCTQRPRLKRKTSDKHEAELNIELVVSAGILPEEVHQLPTNKLSAYYGLNVQEFWPESLLEFENGPKKKIILHVGSHLSARNWPVDHFVRLAYELTRHQFLVFLTGTKAEGDQFREAFRPLVKEKSVIDVTGQMNLKELFGFIEMSDGIVACSTGPLHMGAALGKPTVGIYPPLRPMHAGRWGPIGSYAKAITNTKRPNCRLCVKNPKSCLCMTEIRSDSVLQDLLSCVASAQGDS